MRFAILGLLFCAGTTAFCQSTAPSPATPDTLGQTPLVVTPPARDFSKLPPGWHFSGAVPPRILLQPKMLKLPQPETDPKIIVRPPQASIGVNPPGTPTAQNEYPHLQMRPILNEGDGFIGCGKTPGIGSDSLTEDGCGNRRWTEFHYGFSRALRVERFSMLPHKSTENSPI
jgi:hypothetical protein